MSVAKQLALKKRIWGQVAD